MGDDGAAPRRWQRLCSLAIRDSLCGLGPPVRPRPINLIVSCAENRVIGREGRLPWRIPEDWEFFQNRTRGQVVLLGRICFDSWPGARREGRRPVVVTGHTVDSTPRVASANSFGGALRIAEALPGEIYVCGGQRIYEEAIVLARPIRLHITLVHAAVDGDRWFPDWRRFAWHEVGRRPGRDDRFRYTFLTLERGF
jgi:dihydrofolate reductase